MTAPATLTISYLTLRVTIAEELSWPRSDWDAKQLARLNEIIRSGLLSFYYPALAGGRTHRWSFLQPTVAITTQAPQKTGTIAVAAGVVTLTGATWPTWAASGEISINGQVYAVATRESGTQLTLADTTAAADAGTSYTIACPIVELPADCGGSLARPLTYTTGTSGGYPPVEIRTAADIRIAKQDFSWIDRPRICCIRPKAPFDPTVGPRYELVLAPTPAAAYVFKTEYKVSPTMIDETNLYPHGAAEHGETITEACLAIAEQRFDGGAGIHTQRFAALLEGSVARDADGFTPDNLGYNGDPGEIQATEPYEGHFLFPPSIVATVNGKVYY